jgi:hypothetical protein
MEGEKKIHSTELTGGKSISLRYVVAIRSDKSKFVPVVNELSIVP